MEWLMILPVSIAVIFVAVLGMGAFMVWQDVWYDYIKPHLPESKRAFIKRKLNQFKRELEDV